MNIERTYLGFNERGRLTFINITPIGEIVVKQTGQTVIVKDEMDLYEMFGMIKKAQVLENNQNY